MNIPYGRIGSTLGTAMKYMKPAAWHMAGGAAAGAAYSYASGGQNYGRNMAIGAIAGLGYAKGVGGDFMRGGRAGLMAGNFNIENAFKAAASRQWGAIKGLM